MGFLNLLCLMHGLLHVTYVTATLGMWFRRHQNRWILSQGQGSHLWNPCFPTLHLGDLVRTNMHEHILYIHDAWYEPKSSSFLSATSHLYTSDYGVNIPKKNTSNYWLGSPSMSWPREEEEEESGQKQDWRPGGSPCDFLLLVLSEFQYCQYMAI